MLASRSRMRLGLAGERSSWPITPCLLFVALIAAPLLERSAFAQEAPTVRTFDLSGLVVDEASGQPLAGAWVMLTGSDWGSPTTEEGAFYIPDMDPGAISLTVEILGYETLVWDGSVQEGTSLTFRLKPKPLLLEGLRVVVDRFEARRRDTPMSVRVFDRADLTSTSQETVLEFVTSRMRLFRTDCPMDAWSDVCIRVRGRSAEVDVWVDEAPLIGGAYYLAHMPPYYFYLVEVFGQGRHIRAYTNRFMEHAAEVRLLPVPLMF